MFDLLPLPVLYWNGEGEIFRFNQKAEEELGKYLSREDININSITPVHKFFEREMDFDFIIDAGVVDRKLYRWVSFLIDQSPVIGATIGTRVGLECQTEPDIYSQIFHELNNIITGVLMGLELSLTEKNPEKIKEHVVEEISNIKRISNITSALSSILRGKRIYKRCNANSVLKESVKFIRRTLRKGIHTRLILPEITYIAEIPEEFLYEIMINLLSNARDSIEGEGTIEVSLTGTEKVVRIDIADTGKGIEEDEILRIFEPFYTKKTKGTGLGLYIVKKLINIYGGRIEVMSRQGAGTTFTLFLKGKRKQGG